jgi:1-acyl-sn-glycerol-3-phosphate acyltransferase
MPPSGPLLVCANHSNALVDPLILQAAIPRPLQPLARSGLFDDPLLRPLLRFVGAVPIYRPQDAGSNPARNVDSFARCHEILLQGGALLIFPEGQSHSDSSLRPMKTGAARIALGACEGGAQPTILPAGMTFTRKGRFRSSVLVQLAPPILVSGSMSENSVRELTRRIDESLASVTLNADSWQDVELLARLERFFALRGGRRRRSALGQRFRALKRLIATHRHLSLIAPVEVAALRRKLRRFGRLCNAYGIRSYHLDARYSLPLVLRFCLETALVGLLVLPLGLWGALTSFVPFQLTRRLTRRVTSYWDQYDTARMALAPLVFFVCWGLECLGVYFWWGTLPAVLFAASLPLSAAVALLLVRLQTQLRESLIAFFLFSRRADLHAHLLAQRQQIERAIARLAKLARTLAPDRSSL